MATKLAASSITLLQEALTLFSLKSESKPRFQPNTLYTPPPYLDEGVSRTLTVTSVGTKIRSKRILDQIIIAAVYEEGLARGSRAGVRTTVQARSDSQDERRKDSAASLQLVYDFPLSQEVLFNNEHRRLSGKPDLSIWYSTPDEDRTSFCTSFLVVTTKQDCRIDQALPQLACYMGIVHTAPQRAGETISSVFGLVTDGFDFRFCWIDGRREGRFVYERKVRSWRDPEEQEQIYSMIRGVVCTSALFYRSTSPIRDPGARPICLSFFTGRKFGRKDKVTGLEGGDTDEDETQGENSEDEYEEDWEEE